MCVAMPMKVLEIGEGGEGLAELGAVRRKISFRLLDGAAPGDYVLVHAGFAIARIDEDEARISLELLAECEGEGNGYPSTPP